MCLLPAVAGGVYDVVRGEGGPRGDSGSPPAHVITDIRAQCKRHARPSTTREGRRDSGSLRTRDPGRYNMLLRWQSNGKQMENRRIFICSHVEQMANTCSQTVQETRQKQPVPAPQREGDRRSPRAALSQRHSAMSANAETPKSRQK